MSVDADADSVLEARCAALYRDLKAWQLAMDLLVNVYRTTQGFPKEERFGVIDQMRKAATSVPCNISEGSGRLTRGEFLNFLGIARGSQVELETLIMASIRLGYLASDDLLLECENVGRVLNGLIRSLRQPTPSKARSTGQTSEETNCERPSP